MFTFILNWLKKRRVAWSSVPVPEKNTSHGFQIQKQVHLHWHVSDSSQIPQNVIWNAGQLVTPNVATVDTTARIYDKELLERVRMQWQFGEWETLSEIDVLTVEQHPDRAKIALVVASAWLQLGDSIQARKFTQHAKEWGCDKKLIAQLLIAGVHNTLGRVASLNGDEVRAMTHFRDAVKGVSGDAKLASQARAQTELKKLSHSSANKLISSIGKEPIFIHSLWRAGSTYMFNVFRRSDYGYWAYQEPIHEISLEAKNDPSVLDKYISETLKTLRHPILEKPYFYELQRTHYAWSTFPEKRMILDDYFEKNISFALEGFLRAIISSSEGRPVIQECRTSCRIGTIKKNIGGKHIYLWRNPWSHWQSFKVNDEYFIVMCQIILGGLSVPKIISMIREEISYVEFHSEKITEEIAHFNQKKISSEHSYLVFYTLWCLGLIEGIRHADLLISIDSLSYSLSYRMSINNQLRMLDIIDLDFSDCQVPQYNFGESDREFFIPIEKNVHELLAISGYDSVVINEMIKMRMQHETQKLDNEN